MQQHLMQMRPMMSGGYYPNNVTTDHIQQYLDENKSLILKIVESQTSGKLSECAENQARLQRNLMYLAAIADSQPQPPAVHNQYPPSGAMQSGAQYAQQQQQQAQQMSQQSLMAARSSMLYSQQPYAALQQQALHNSQLGMGSGSTTGLHMMQQQSEASNAAGGTSTLGGFPDFGRKHAMGGTDGSSEGRGGGDGGDNLYLKASGDGN